VLPVRRRLEEKAAQYLSTRRAFLHRLTELLQIQSGTGHATLRKARSAARRQSDAPIRHGVMRLAARPRRLRAFDRNVQPSLPPTTFTI